jgi:hypothetical protein
MTRTIYIPRALNNSGINISWTPSEGRLDIGGWFDINICMERGTMTLAEFFAKLGITQKDVQKALSENRLGCTVPLRHPIPFQAGTVVRNRGSGNVYTVIANYGDSSVAVRECRIMNPSEWDIVSTPNVKDEVPK